MTRLEWKHVDAMIESFEDMVPGAQWHIAHIQLEDCNLSDGFINDAIRGIDATLSGEPPSDDVAVYVRIHREALENGEITELDIRLTRAFLVFLLAVPESVRDSYWEDET